MDVDVDNDLQCPICLELYTYPIILPCSHVLCRSPCAEQLFDFNFIRCPVCRDNCYVSGGISSLPRVIALENIIERYKSERKKDKNSTDEKSSTSQTTSSIPNQSSTNETLVKSLSLLNNSVHSLSSLAESLKSDTEIKCQNCKSAATRKRAKKYCTTCESNFCATCLRQTHPNKDPFTNHEFTEPKMNSLNKVSQKCANTRHSGASLGSTYREVIDSYCSLCTQPFSSGSDERMVHNSHPVLPIEHAYRDFKVCENVWFSFRNAQTPRYIVTRILTKFNKTPVTKLKSCPVSHRSELQMVTCNFSSSVKVIRVILGTCLKGPVGQ